MASIITATTTSGLTQSADNSGVLQLASGTGNLVTVPSTTGTMALTASPTFTGTATIPTATVTTLNTPSGVLATQNGMTGIAKAWVNYNLITQTIRSSFNVSSVTYVSTGQFTVNFTTAMPNAEYATVGMAQEDTGGGGRWVDGYGTPTTTSRTIETRNSSNTLINAGWAGVAFFA